MHGGGEGVIKDSASSVPSGELSAQPYIARVGTEDSGCAAARTPPPLPLCLPTPCLPCQAHLNSWGPSQGRASIAPSRHSCAHSHRHGSELPGSV